MKEINPQNNLKTLKQESNNEKQQKDKYIITFKLKKNRI